MTKELGNEERQVQRHEDRNVQHVFSSDFHSFSKP